MPERTLRQLRGMSTPRTATRHAGDGVTVSIFLERVKDLERRVERLEQETDDEAMGKARVLVGNWAKMLTDATQNPNVNWSQVNHVIDKMREFARVEK
jgi:hypothetical protein